MENRFGIKDLILFLLVAVVIVIMVLSLVQTDRQWGQLLAINAKIESHSNDLREIRETLARGFTATTTAAGGDIPLGPDDPFARIRAAEAMPGYARGDWLINVFGAQVAKLTPLLSGDIYASNVQENVLESLAVRDPVTLGWKPLLAKSWQISDDGLTITFELRKGVHFSDGVPLTADDVVFTYNFIMNPKIAAPRYRSYIERIKKVESDGPQRVTFTYAEPYFQAFELAATLPVMPAHFYGKFSAEEFNQSVGLLLGSGPYRMPDPTSWKPNTEIYLVRNDRYWGVRPAFDRLVYKEIQSDKSRLQLFINGGADVFSPSPEQYRDLLKNEALLKRTQHFEYQNPIGGYGFVAWNEVSDGKPTVFADKRVRQAMTMLLDRQRMIKQIMLGYAVIATGPFNPLSKQYDPNVQPWPYDVDRARQLLSEAGCTMGADKVLRKPDGRPFEFRLTYPTGSPIYDKMVLFMKDAYARAGILLNPDPQQWIVFTDRLDKKNFDAITLGWSAGIETDIYQMFHSSQRVAGGDDFISYRNPELDKLIEEARSTIQEDKRMPLWQKCHDILHEDQPYTFLWFGKSLRFVDGRIHNVELLKLGLNPLEEWFVPAGEQKYTR